MKLSRILEGTNMVMVGKDLKLPVKISPDSRSVVKGGGFVALRGARTDGHRFIPDVLSKGVSFVLCEKGSFKEEWKDEYPKCTFVLSDEKCEYALARLASFYVEHLKHIKEVVAITGSVGKTSTKNYAQALLEGHFKVHVAAGNYNTLIGSSITALGAPKDTEILILEMGANHRGEIAEMVGYLPPTVVCVTEVAPAHLLNFGTLEGVLDAKSEIFASKRLKSAVINGDNSLLSRRADELKLPEVIRFGHRGNVTFEGERVSWDGKKFIVEAIMTGLDGVSFKTTLQLSGVHQLYPVAAACAIAGKLGLSSHDIADSLPKCHNSAGRGEIKFSSTGAAIIDESYNASPASMLALLSSMSTPDILGKRVLVLGAMGELGEATEFQHELVFRRALQVSDKLYLYGKAWQSIEGTEKYWWPTLDDIITKIDDEELGDGDVVLVKGSRSNFLEQVVRALEV